MQHSTIKSSSTDLDSIEKYQILFPQMKSHSAAPNIPKRETLFNCVNPLESLRCRKCPNFKTHKLVELLQHFKGDHKFVKLEVKIYQCERCSFLTYSKYLVLRHKLFNLCIIDKADTENFSSDTNSSQESIEQTKENICLEGTAAVLSLAIETTSLAHETSRDNASKPSDEILQQCPEKKRLPDICCYCNKEVQHFARHLQRSHSQESEVQKICSSQPRSRDRKRLIASLRKKGNYQKNLENLYKPVRRSYIDNSESNYFPCPFCLGMYSRRFLWRHKRICPEKKNPVSLHENQGLLPKNEDLLLNVFSSMHIDKVGFVARKDKLIGAFGARFVTTHRNLHYVNMCSSRMRELAKILMESQKINPEIKNLLDILQPKYFQTVIESIKFLAKYDTQKSIYLSPTFAINSIRSLKDCCNIAITRSNNNKIVPDSEVEDKVKSFAQLLENNCKNEILKKSNTKTSNKITKSLEAGTSTKINKFETPGVDPGNFSLDCIFQEAAIEEIEENLIKPPPIVSTIKRQLTPWTKEQKRVVICFFKKHIKNKKPPRRLECEELKEAFPHLLENKSWTKIKVFVQNCYTNKTKYVDQEQAIERTEENIVKPPPVVSNTKRQLTPWTNEQKRVVVCYFKKHIKCRKSPTRLECEDLKDIFPHLLENKSWTKIKVFIQNCYTNKIKYIDHREAVEGIEENIKPPPVVFKTKRQLTSWTKEQKEIVVCYFKKHIKRRKSPTRLECEEMKGIFPDLLENKSWTKIKVFIQNCYTNKTKYVGWD